MTSATPSKKRWVPPDIHSKTCNCCSCLVIFVPSRSRDEYLSKHLRWWQLSHQHMGTSDTGVPYLMSMFGVVAKPEVEKSRNHMTMKPAAFRDE